MDGFERFWGCWKVLDNLARSDMKKHAEPSRQIDDDKLFTTVFAYGEMLFWRSSGWFRRFWGSEVVSDALVGSGIKKHSKTIQKDPET